jgi:DNA processing protein
MSSFPLESWIALSLLPGLGPISIRRCLEQIPDPAAIAYRAPASFFAEIPRTRGATPERILAARAGLRAAVERELRTCEQRGLTLLPLPDDRYPSALALLPDAPVILYMKGTLPEGIVRVAVVGSRRATAYGRRVATGLSIGLASRGVEVVSGGARGIDTCAHLGALESGGRTVAVLGSGFLRLYPAENEALFDRIAAAGCVLSEFPLDTPPTPENFPRRNRLVSGLAAAVVVVEATERSGSLTTAGHALDQGREVLAVPGPVSSDQSAGCHRLIQQGAKLVQRVEDVLEDLSPMYRGAIGPAPTPPPGREGPRLEGLDADEAAVLGLLDDPEPVHLDALAEEAPFGIARLLAALFSLELRGAVEQLPGRYYLPRLRMRS